jgi:hypothetical protein
MAPGSSLANTLIESSSMLQAEQRSLSTSLV